MAHRILVVDDNELNLQLVAKILEMEGYEVAMAHNGMQAIQAAIQFKPDMAVLDIMMPDMNGFELCRKLRQPPISAEMPIVMLTAMNSEMEQAQAREAGANDILSKPFDVDAFRERTRELLTKA